jgi:hypothetical protein
MMMASKGGRVGSSDSFVAWAISKCASKKGDYLRHSLAEQAHSPALNFELSSGCSQHEFRSLSMYC